MFNCIVMEQRKIIIMTDCLQLITSYLFPLQQKDVYPIRFTINDGEGRENCLNENFLRELLKKMFTSAWTLSPPHHQHPCLNVGQSHFENYLNVLFRCQFFLPPHPRLESCFYARAKFGVSYATTVWAMTSLMYWLILLEPCLSYLMWYKFAKKM